MHKDLGGKATISNLTPTKTGLNTRFYEFVEQHAVKDKNQKPIWYRVIIFYHNETGFTDYIRTINASYGNYEKKNGNWQYGKTLYKFVEDSPKPVFGDRIYNLNTDGAIALSGAGIDFNFANLKFSNFDDFYDRMILRQSKGRVKNSKF